MITTSPRLQGRFRSTGAPRAAFVLAGTLVLAAALRLVGIDWDARQHLHPDERFLSMVESSLRLPSSAATWFDEARSTLNPRNVGFPFFPYGTLPTTLVKVASERTGLSGFDQVTLVGRGVSALADLVTLVLLYVLALRLTSRRPVALLAAFLYAVSVLPIQQSHFFTVDALATCLTTATLLALERVQARGERADWVAAGALLGLAAATKISVATLVVVAAAVAGTALVAKWREGPAPHRTAAVESLLLRFVLLLAAAGVVFRIAQPDAFRGPGLFGILPSDRWLANLREVGELVSGEKDIPPSVQWAGRTPFVWPLSNLALWGMGVPLAVAAAAGTAAAVAALARRRAPRLLVPAAWVLVVVLHQGAQWVSSMRYMLPAYPCLCLLAAWGLVSLGDMPGRRRVAGALTAGVCLASAAWAFAFVRIYQRPHPRVEASRWIYAHVPPGANVACEQWDDPLPLKLGGPDPFPAIYRGTLMNWYDEDTPEKLERALRWLDAADVIVLSSDRAAEAIPRIPIRWPMTVRYYEKLFDGSLGFAPAATFTSFPGALGLSISDHAAEEAFTVYDHPRVRIFRKTPEYSHERAARSLAVDLGTAISIRARQVSQAPNALMLTPGAWSRLRAGGTWTRIFDPAGWGARAPLLAWAGLLLLLGALGAPLLLAACPGLPDGGFAFARTAALLLTAWIAWLLSSTGLAPFSRRTLVLAVFLVAAAAVATAVRLRRRISDLARARRGILAVEEGLFWLAFAAFVLIRRANPDLWHPTLGGEKPMDLAFLTAVVKSAEFPPYDPWLAGGALNYYYFGYVLVAALVKLTAVVPAVAYNLAIPTLFALAFTGAFGAALALVGPARQGRGRTLGFAVLGAFLVAALGNLGEVRLYLGAAASASTTTFSSPVPGLTAVVRTADGLAAAARSGRPLVSHRDWPYWAATRVISHPPTEPGPISEMPFFTYLFGDLHAHGLALPLALLVFGLAGAIASSPPAGSGPEVLLLTFAALGLGALVAANTWDAPTYGIVIGAALLLRPRRDGSTRREHLAGAAVRGACVLAGAFGLFLPFHRSWGRAYGGFEAWTGSQTPLPDFLTIYGFFLFVLGSVLWFELSHAAARADLRRFLSGSDPRAAFVRNVTSVSLLLAAVLFALGRGTSGLLVVLLTATTFALARERSDAGWRLALAAAAMAFALLLGSEWVVLRGDVGRMNTVFKFGFQAWVLLALAAAAGASRARSFVLRLPAAARAAWGGAFALLLAAGLLYPALATGARVRDRFDPNGPRGLDGAAFLRTASIDLKGTDVPLEWDRQAFEWIQAHVTGSPVVAEANTDPVLYGWGNRYSMFTGLPSVVGWRWHEVQQRAAVGAGPVDRRIADLRLFFTTEDAAEAARVAARYGVGLVVVGPLERSVYGEKGLAKFGAGGPFVLLYENPGVKLYRIATAS